MAKPEVEATTEDDEIGIGIAAGGTKSERHSIIGTDHNHNVVSINHNDDDQVQVGVTVESKTSHLVNDDEQDYKAKLLGGSTDAVYNECTIPLNASDDEDIDDGSRSSLFAKTATQITGLFPQITSNSCGQLASGVNNGFTQVDLGASGLDTKPPFNEDEDELGVGQIRLTNKPSVHGDMLQSINNLRMNVNNHIIGGSKNVIGRMRKLSISELNRHGHSTSRKYKIAFYGALTTLTLLFLYLIYQNLFNDK